MAYKKSPASFMKHKSNAVGYMAEGSAFHLDTDPKDGVVVTGTDKTKSAADARAKRLAKRKK